MSRAEERALEAYPYSPTEVNLFGHKTIVADGNSCDRGKYRQGYEQAEKDLTLTWEDIRLIDALICTIASNDNKVGKELYEEVLREFNESKKN